MRRAKHTRRSESGSGAVFTYDRAMMTRGWRKSSVEHCVPDFGRSAALDAQGTQSELTLANAMLEFDASDRDGGVVEDLEAEHRSGPRLHASVVLLDHVVQVFRRPQLRALPMQAFTRHLFHGA